MIPYHMDVISWWFRGWSILKLFKWGIVMNSEFCKFGAPKTIQFLKFIQIRFARWTPPLCGVWRAPAQVWDARAPLRSSSPAVANRHRFLGASGRNDHRDVLPRNGHGSEFTLGMQFYKFWLEQFDLIISAESSVHVWGACNVDHPGFGCLRNGPSPNCKATMNPEQMLPCACKATQRDGADAKKDQDGARRCFREGNLHLKGQLERFNLYACFRCSGHDGSCHDTFGWFQFKLCWKTAGYCIMIIIVWWIFRASNTAFSQRNKGRSLHTTLSPMAFWLIFAPPHLEFTERQCHGKPGCTQLEAKELVVWGECRGNSLTESDWFGFLCQAEAPGKVLSWEGHIKILVALFNS